MVTFFLRYVRGVCIVERDYKNVIMRLQICVFYQWSQIKCCHVTGWMLVFLTGNNANWTGMHSRICHHNKRFCEQCFPLTVLFLWSQVRHVPLHQNNDKEITSLSFTYHFWGKWLTVALYLLLSAQNSQSGFVMTVLLWSVWLVQKSIHKKLGKDIQLKAFHHEKKFSLAY